MRRSGGRYLKIHLKHKIQLWLALYVFISRYNTFPYLKLILDIKEEMPNLGVYNCSWYFYRDHTLWGEPGRGNSPLPPISSAHDNTPPLHLLNSS